MKIDKLSTHDDFKKLCFGEENESRGYWNPGCYNKRWSYHSVVLDMLKNDIDNIDTILEVGNNGFYFSSDSIAIAMEGTDRVRDSDIVMDIRTTTEGRPGNWRNELYDGEVEITCKWPFEDKQFDMFIALQVWEHLWNTNSPKVFDYWNPTERMKKYGVEYPNVQASVFKEVMRCCKNAIISFPYMWTAGEIWHRPDQADVDAKAKIEGGYPIDNVHYQVSRENIKKWTAGVEPTEIIDGHNDHKSGVRSVYRWKF